MTAGVREALQKAKTAANEEYDNWQAKVSAETEEWAALGYGPTKAKMTVDKVKSAVTDNWKAITFVATAFGLPVSAADEGAFSGIIDLVSNILPF